MKKKKSKKKKSITIRRPAAKKKAAKKKARVAENRIAVRYQVVEARLLDRVFEEIRKHPGKPVRVRGKITAKDVDLFHVRGDSDEISAIKEKIMSGFEKRFKMNSGKVLDLR